MASQLPDSWAPLAIVIGSAAAVDSFGQDIGVGNLARALAPKAPNLHWQLLSLEI